MSFFVGIPSYLPDKHRQVRLTRVLRCIEYIRKISKDFEIMMVLDNWQDADIMTLAPFNVTYEKISYRNVAKSRNHILKLFYESNKDYLWLTDDDVLWYDTPDSIFPALINNPIELLLKSILTWTGGSGFATSNYFVPVPILDTGLIFVANLRKHFGFEVYQREELVADGYGGEDLVFECDIFAKTQKLSYIYTGLIHRLDFQIPSAFWQGQEQKDKTKEYVRSLNIGDRTVYEHAIRSIHLAKKLSLDRAEQKISIV